MLPNWTGWKTVKLVLAIIAAAAGGVAGAHIADPVTTVANTVTTLDGIVLSIVVVLSGTSAGPTIAAKAAKTLAVLLVAGGVAVGGAIAIEACIPNPASQLSDGLSLEQCVQREWGQPVASVITACGPGIASAVVDTIADLVVFLDRQTDGGASAMLAVYANDYRIAAALPNAQLRYAAKHAASP